MPCPIDHSRDLLFGLLALQTGLINQAQLVAAFHAWTQARDRPMAEILAGQGAISAPCVLLVEGLVGEHLRRHGDDPERSLAAIGVGRSTRECLARIGNPELDASLAHVGAGSAGPEDDPERTASFSVGEATSDGQRFRVLRPHAQGGLGAVFVALDAELHREVALKQILDHHANDPISRQRFVIEAEITGGLEHPGVVPVYGLGSYGDGRPYYAMRFIQGDSLKQAIERFHADARLQQDPGRRSLELRTLLRRFIDVCNAIAYAHSRGVLHRDIKPGNVIVGKYGETLVVDWGLAKAVGRDDPGAAADERTLVPSSSSSLAETLPGSALGTPAYMSPEQAAGELDRLGPRSDVYSLGATLYCLLTGRPPFLGDDVGLTLRQVQQGEFPAPRTIDPALDQALEAVCLKAMAPKPEDRYASPRALADDVERWAADEPVTARPEPFAERARRWMRRNRTGVMTATAAMVVALVGTAAVLAVQTRANLQLSKANRDLKASNEALAVANSQVSKAYADLQVANERVAARFELALAAIRLFHGEVSEDLLLKQKQLEGLRSKLLRGAADFYRKLEGQLKPQADQASRAALGRAYEALGEVTDKIDSKPEALAIHSQALAVRRALAAEPGADATVTGDVTRSLLAIGDLQRMTGDASKALSSYRESLAICEALALANPEVTQFQRNLASSHHNIGLLLYETGKPAEALEAYGKGRAIQQKLADAHPAVTQFQSDLAKSHVNIGGVLIDTGKPREALASYQAARAIQQRLADAHPAVTQFQLLLGYSHIGIGIFLKETGQPEEALASLKAAQGIQQRLADANPTVTDFQIGLANTLLETGDVLRLTGRPAEARPSYEDALKIIEVLTKAQPTLASFSQVYLVFGLKGLGATQQAAGQADDAVATWRRAIASDERTRTPLSETQYYLAGCHARLGGIAGAAGSGLSAAEGAAELDRAMVLLRRAIAGGYRKPTWMKRDPDLDPLRVRPDFRLLMMDLAMPVDPFSNEPGADH